MWGKSFVKLFTHDDMDKISSNTIRQRKKNVLDNNRYYTH
jgi:hypothetical protein